MFLGRDPHVAVKMLYEIGILQHSLKIPTSCEGKENMRNFRTIGLNVETAEVVYCDEVDTSIALYL